MERTHIALLRGVNVSGTNKLPMKQLIELAEGIGLSNCHTYIQSGNLVFKSDETARLAGDIATAVEKAFGFRPPVILRSLLEWKEMIAHCPFMAEAGEDAKSVHVFVLEEEPKEERLKALSEREFADDRWRLGKGVVYLHLPSGLGRSKLATSIERILKVPMTGRNWQTVLAIEALGENS